MPKDMKYNIGAVILGIGGPILALFFFKKAVDAARKELVIEEAYEMEENDVG